MLSPASREFQPASMPVSSSLPGASPPPASAFPTYPPSRARRLPRRPRLARTLLCRHARRPLPRGPWPELLRHPSMRSRQRSRAPPRRCALRIRAPSCLLSSPRPLFSGLPRSLPRCPRHRLWQPSLLPRACRLSARQTSPTPPRSTVAFGTPSGIALGPRERLPANFSCPDALLNATAPCDLAAASDLGSRTTALSCPALRHLRPPPFMTPSPSHARRLPRRPRLVQALLVLCHHARRPPLRRPWRQRRSFHSRPHSRARSQCCALRTCPISCLLSLPWRPWHRPWRSVPSLQCPSVGLRPGLPAISYGGGSSTRLHFS